MPGRIARSAALGLVLFMTAAGMLPSSADPLPLVTGGTVEPQDQAPAGRKRNQRCRAAPPAGCQRAGQTNNPPDVTLTASERQITQPCRDDTASQGCTPSASQQVQLQALASDGDGDTLRYIYSATGGRISGEGPNVTWELTGVRPGTYTATVEVDDMCGCVAFTSTTVKVAACDDCGSKAR